MAKKRNCRRTEQEKKDHKKVVALKKQTNEQFLESFAQQYKDGYDAGYAAGLEKGKKTASTSNQANNSKEHFLNYIEFTENIKGIGTATISKIIKAFNNS